MNGDYVCCSDVAAAQTAPGDAIDIDSETLFINENEA